MRRVEVEVPKKEKGVIPYLTEEVDYFQEEVTRFQRGEVGPEEFMAFRLKQGVYGQRQPEAQMFRVKIPYGRLTAEQLEVLGIIARDYTPLQKGHITTRENIQFHFVKLEKTAEIMRLLGEVGLTTREACGNTVRNVVGCPLAGVCPREPFDVSPYAAAYARYFVRHPVTQAMPRKFKTAFSGCDLDCAITGIHDLGFIPLLQDGRRGFRMFVGGGTSIMPRLAQPLFDFVPVEEYLKVSEAVLRIFDRCDELRKNRMKARIKVLIDRVGIEEFRRMVEEELRQPWAQKNFDPTPLLFLDEEEKEAPPLAISFPSGDGSQDPAFETWSQTNVIPQKQPGYYAVVVTVPIGDIYASQFPMLAEIARRYASGQARLTQQQNLLFRWVPQTQVYEVWQRLQEVGLGDPGREEIGDVVACPGTQSCKLGITASLDLGRVLIEEVRKMKMEDPLVRRMSIKISGCPNGCGQHHVADMGFHGAVMKGDGGQIPAYEIFLGGKYRFGAEIGQRLPGVRIPAKRVPEAIKRIVDFYTRNRLEDEGFRDFVHRVGVQAFGPVLEGIERVGPLNPENMTYYVDWGMGVLYKLQRGEGECAV